jgi:hypothetical protein
MRELGKPLARGRKPKPEREISKASKRKRHQRKLEDHVRLHEFLVKEAARATVVNPGAKDFHYQGTQAKIGGKQYDRVAERLKRNR